MGSIPAQGFRDIQPSELSVGLRWRSCKPAIDSSDDLAQAQCICDRVTACRVVEDAPGIATIPHSRLQHASQRLKSRVVIRAVIHARRAVPTPVAPWTIFPRLAGVGRTGRIGGHARDVVALPERIEFRAEPACMTRLAGQRNLEELAQQVEKSVGPAPFMDQAWRQLDEYAAELAPEA